MITRAQKVVATVKPSTSTVASGAIGVPAGILIVYLIETLGGLVLPDDVKIAIGSLVTVAAGYFFSGGRSADTI